MLVMVRTTSYKRKKKLRSILKDPELRLWVLLFAAGIVWVWFT